MVTLAKMVQVCLSTVSLFKAIRLTTLQANDLGSMTNYEERRKRGIAKEKLESRRLGTT